MPPCDDFAEDLAAYSWGALDADERARVDRHRAHCSGCDQWLRDSEHALAQMDEAMPRIPPPSELRGRLLASIDGIVQSVHPDANLESRRADGPVRIARSPVPEALTPRRAHFRDPGRHIRPPQRAANGRARTFLTGVTTGLLGALAAAVVIVTFVLRPQDLSGLTPRQSAYGSSDSGPPLLPGFLPAAGGGATPSARLLELRSASTSARGWLTYDAGTRRGVLLVEGLTAAEGSVFDVWLVEGSQRLELGTLAIDPRGVGTFVLPDPLPFERPDRIDVTPRGAAGTDSPPLLTTGF